MKTIVIYNGIRMLKKNIFSVATLTLLTILCFYLLGIATVAGQEGNKQKEEYMSNYGNKILYATSELLSDTRYNCFINDKSGKTVKKVRKFVDMLGKSDKFSFCSLFPQYIELINKKVPKQFLYGYEDDLSEQSVQRDQKETLYDVKAIQVSDSFLNEFHIEIQDGKSFLPKDYSFNKERKIPVLLGSSYKDIFKVGDRFQAYYLCKKMTFYVKGILNDRAFSYNSSKGTMDSCERLIVIPVLSSDKNNWFSRVSLLNQVTGLVNSSLGGEETKVVFDEYLSECGLKGWEFNIHYIGDDSKSDIFSEFSSMTEEVARQLRMLIFLIFVFANLITLMVLCSMIRKNFSVFGTEMLCGSSIRDIICECGVVSVAISLMASICASLLLALFEYSAVAILLVWIAAVCIIMITLLVMGSFIKRMQLNTYIGGKE